MEASMAPFIETIRNTSDRFLRTWENLDWGLIKFGRQDEAVLFGFILGAVFISALLIRYLRRGKIGRKQVVLPTIIQSFTRSSWSFVRHVPVFFFILGLPLFLIALADPFLSFVREETTYPGRRIALLVDASSSMDGEFISKKFKTSKNERFYTAVSAAKHFVEVRMKGEYKDLMALIEFGNESYIITPFTNDYKNILTSLALISEPEERNRFSDSGTVIIKAIDQGVELFKSFDFLKASGNIIILISDGEDVQVVLEGKSLDSILDQANVNKIPIYFIRTVYNTHFGDMTNVNFGLIDNLWKDAVEKTGGKFYAAENEGVILQAVNDIDKLAIGKIELQRYSSKKPLFWLFLETALIVWIIGFVMALAFKLFRTFP